MMGMLGAASFIDPLKLRHAGTESELYNYQYSLSFLCRKLMIHLLDAVTQEKYAAPTYVESTY
jgi:hypothetical protein